MFFLFTFTQGFEELIETEKNTRTKALTKGAHLPVFCLH